MYDTLIGLWRLCSEVVPYKRLCIKTREPKEEDSSSVTFFYPQIISWELNQ